VKGVLEGGPLEKSLEGDGWLTTGVSPTGWNPLPFCIGGRRVGGVESAQVGEKAEEKSLVKWKVEVGERIIVAQSRLEYLR
jgi:hypothetical protein